MDKYIQIKSLFEEKEDIEKSESISFKVFMFNSSLKRHIFAYNPLIIQYMI